VWHDVSVPLVGDVGRDRRERSALVAVLGQVDDAGTVGWHGAADAGGRRVKRYGRASASPPARVDADRQTESAMSSETSLTDPSIIATLTAPGW